MGGMGAGVASGMTLVHGCVAWGPRLRWWVSAAMRVDCFEDEGRHLATILLPVRSNGETLVVEFAVSLPGV
jgi:hypothetical protein